MGYTGCEKGISFTYDDASKLLSSTENEDNYGTYTYTYEYDLMGNRTAVVKTDERELLMAAAYDGDGNRVYQLNYNLHTDEDWKGNSGNGNGSNKDNSGSGNSRSNNGNATNAETNNSQNQCGILFPTDSETSDTESYLISLIKIAAQTAFPWAALTAARAIISMTPEEA